MSVLADFLRERNEALSSLDIAWARAQSPVYVDDDTIMIALHKARHACIDIEPELRHASGEWLRSRGYHSLGMLPVTDELPK